MQAAILRVLLPHLDAENNDRKAFAAFYDSLFREAGYEACLPPSPDGAVYHQYAVTLDRRDILMKWLRRHGIGTNVHYALPLPQHSAFAEASVSEPYDCFPVAEELSRTVLSLPIQSELRVHERKIGDAVRQSLAAMRG
jgi:dTDP-4-amino-4,6-dideoxygalactose transaminase